MEFSSVNKLLEKSFREHWDRPALSNYQGATLCYRDVARRIAKLQIAFEQCGLKKGDKVVTVGGIYGEIVEVNEKTVLIRVDGDVKLRVDKQGLVKDYSDAEQK